MADAIVSVLADFVELCNDAEFQAVDRARGYADALAARAVAAERERDEGWFDFASEAIPDFDFSGCYDNDEVRNHLIGQIGQLRENAEAAEARLAVATELQENLVLLVRFGFLVSVNGERATADAIKDGRLRELLFSILQAKDVAAARAVLVGGDAGLEDPAFDDRLGHGEGRLKPPELHEDAA